MRRWTILLLAAALASGCETTRKVDKAVFGTLNDAVKALDRITPETDASGRIRFQPRKQEQTVHDFVVPEHCVQNGVMRTEPEDCALLNQAIFEGCVYRSGQHDLWWTTKPHCKAIFDKYSASQSESTAQEEKP